MAAERSIEVKVGALILVSIAILGGFILVMGGLSFQKTYPLYVDFDNPGGLLSGAAVRIGGVKVGSVKNLEFLGGKVDPKTGRRVLVRATLGVEERVKDSRPLRRRLLRHGAGRPRRAVPRHRAGEPGQAAARRGRRGEGDRPAAARSVPRQGLRAPRHDGEGDKQQPRDDRRDRRRTSARSLLREGPELHRERQSRTDRADDRQRRGDHRRGEAAHARRASTSSTTRRSSAPSTTSPTSPTRSTTTPGRCSRTRARRSRT